MNDEYRNITIEDLIEKVKTYNTNEKDIDLINRAFDYAYKKHFGQKRISGDDYITHPLNVAMILTDINADATCLAAALLHDTIEDSDSTKEEVTKLVYKHLNDQNPLEKHILLTDNSYDINNILGKLDTYKFTFTLNSNNYYYFTKVEKI